MGYERDKHINVEEDSLGISLTLEQAFSLSVLIKNGTHLIKQKIKHFKDDKDMANEIQLLKIVLGHSDKIDEELIELMEELEMAKKEKKSIITVPK